MTSRYSKGGLETRFIVRRTDGKPCRPEARYFVVDYSGSDPAGVAAMLAYADAVEATNPDLATDLRAAVADPKNAPAQHENAAP